MKFRYDHREGNWRKIVLIGGVILLMVVAFFVVQQLRQRDSAKAEMERVRKEVGRLVILPDKEEPTLATVVDKSKLTNAFLKANAETGDKVLVYPQAKKVFIYRPSVKRLAAMGPLVLDPSAAEVRGARIAIRSGNGDKKVAEEIRGKLLANYQTAAVGEISDAARQSYPTTIVIDLTKEGDKYNLVTHMMGVLNAQRGILPQGEQVPENVDILIITGLDKKQ